MVLMVGSIDGLRVRIRKLVLQTVAFARDIPKDEVGRVFVNQLLRSITSIGANFEEASEAQTPRDVVYKLSVVKKEAKESKYWLELVCELYSGLSLRGKILVQEVSELVMIFSSIIQKEKTEH